LFEFNKKEICPLEVLLYLELFIFIFIFIFIFEREERLLLFEEHFVDKELIESFDSIVELT
jgi:hypothetical protein